MNYSYIKILTIVGFLFLQLLNAQDFQKADSLKILLEQSSGTEKAKLLKQIGDNYQQGEHYQKAITYFHKSLEICNEYKDTLLQASVLRDIGSAFFYLFDLDKSLKYYLKALNIYEQLNNKNGILKTLNCIGNTYSKCNNNKALEYYLKSYKISEQTGNKKGLYSVLNNIGTLYLFESNYEKALEYFQKALLLMKEVNDSPSMSTPIQNIGFVYYKMQKYDTALYYCFKALNLKEKFNNKLGIARAKSNIAKLYINKNDLASAKIYLNSSLQISNEIDAKGILKNNYYYYTLFYAIKGDLINMQKYSDLYDAITDTIINEQSSRLIAEMQTKYETEKKEQHIEILNIENKLKETQLQSRTYWMLIFIIAFTLVVIFIAILFIQKRRLIFANTNLVQKNLEIVKSEKKLIDANTKLSAIVNEHEKSSMENTKYHAIKYTGSPLTDEQKQDIKSSIVNYMNNNKNYLSIDYTENTLAKDLDISRTYISQVINELLGKSFSALLNEYRIKEARKILSSPKNFKYTIEYVAGMVGYKSKASFNNAFKKYVGLTPSFYLNSIKNDNS